jgi:hypothetical protein
MNSTLLTSESKNWKMNKSGEIAIPEIQRPFVWDATKVRNLLDSLYQGYPVGYLIAWRNPSVRLKDIAGRLMFLYCATKAAIASASPEGPQRVVWAAAGLVDATLS